MIPTTGARMLEINLGGDEHPASVRFRMVQPVAIEKSWATEFGWMPVAA